MTISRNHAIRGALLALFFLSGACGLVYEVVWMRMLTPVSYTHLTLPTKRIV